MSPTTVFQHGLKAFPVFMLVWLEKRLIFQSCPTHTLCLLANQPQVIQHEVAAGDAHAWCGRCSPVKCRTGTNTLLHCVATHRHELFPPSPCQLSSFFMLIVDLALKQGETGGHLKWSLKTWSSPRDELCANKLSKPAGIYVMFCSRRRVCTCPLGFAEAHLSSA